MNPPNFYLWGFLKDTVYENHPTSIAELKQAITSKIRKIKKTECVKVINKYYPKNQEVFEAKWWPFETCA